MNDSGLINHAQLTIKVLEQHLQRRGWTTGKKKWELQLLFSAYKSLGVEAADRKFGLGKMKTIDEVQKPW